MYRVPNSVRMCTPFLFVCLFSKITETVEMVQVLKDESGVACGYRTFPRHSRKKCRKFR
jgi:hypothetical protein